MSGAAATATLTMDTRDTDFSSYRWAWGNRFGAEFRLPSFSEATMADFRVRTRSLRVADVLVVDQESWATVRTGGAPGAGEAVTLWFVRRGELTLDIAGGADRHAGPAGRVLMQHMGRPSHFAASPSASVTAVTLLAPELTALLARQGVAHGSARSAETRLLLAHAGMVNRVAGDLTPAGVLAARDTLTELSRAVLLGAVDLAEPRFGPALAEAAKRLANQRLRTAGLGVAMLAGELNVSVRTLQRAFAASGESVTSWIRDRRLEEARRDLAGAAGRLTVSEIAARWQFADGGHLSRAFKRRYGHTPSDYARGKPADPAAVAAVRHSNTSPTAT